MKRVRAMSYESWSREALIARIRSLESSVSNQEAAVDLPAAPGVASSPSSAASGSEAATDASGLGATNALKVTEPITGKNKRPLDFTKYATRHIALRFAYLGWKYHGLAFHHLDAEVEYPTVEGTLLHALYKTRCIPAIDPSSLGWTRCGRTDAEVSAAAQVVTLNVRSQLPVDLHGDPSSDSRELDYLKILNSHLPDDIIVYEICLRPPQDFDARFSCSGRHYRYYFSPEGLDTEAMRDAARRFVGVDRDFRNFCKIDPTKQIENFKRTIRSAEILQRDKDMWYLSLRGTAFLWNQVRSMMAILFLVGQGHERPEIVDELLDVDRMPRRPSYEIAWAAPLVLYDCEFPPMEWKRASYTSPDKLFDVWHEYRQKTEMAATMLEVVTPYSKPLTSEFINVGHGLGRRCTKYIPLSLRPLCDPPEVVNKRWANKQERKSSRIL